MKYGAAADLCGTVCRSLPARGVWIEMDAVRPASWGHRSLPARGVWIEIALQNVFVSLAGVTPRKGSVD